MKKDTLIRVVVMVVALLAASYLANILTPMQKEISIEKGELTKAPIAGSSQDHGGCCMDAFHQCRRWHGHHRHEECR